LKISAKNAVFLVSSGEKHISPRLAPYLEKLLEKSTNGPFKKIDPTPIHTSM